MTITNHIRPQDLLSSKEEISCNDDKEKKSADDPGESKKSVTHLSRVFITDAHKDAEIKKYAQAQPCSSSGCVDEYFADPVELDTVHSADSANASLNQSSILPESSATGLPASKNTIKFDDKNDMGKDAETEVKAPLILSKQAQEDLHGKPAFDMKSLNTEEQQKGGRWPTDVWPTIESDFSVDHAFQRQQYEDASSQVTQNFAFYIYYEKLKKCLGVGPRSLINMIFYFHVLFPLIMSFYVAECRRWPTGWL